MSLAVTKAYDFIRASILNGGYPVGHRLKEGPLASEIGVSRTPVREALRRLAAEGFIVFTPNHGAYISSWSDQELADIFDLRMLLEGQAARLAARRISPEELAELRDLADRMCALASATTADMDEIAQLNTRFHRLLLQASRSDRLAKLLEAIIEIPIVLRTFEKYSVEGLRRSMNHHREIVAAVTAGNGEWAASVMHSHVLAARHTLMSGRGEDEM